MSDRTFLLLGMIFFSILILSFFGYKYYTESIIRGQEQEIRKLKTDIRRLEGDNRRLRAAIRQRTDKKPIVLDYPATTSPARDHVENFGAEFSRQINKGLQEGARWH